MQCAFPSQGPFTQSLYRTIASGTQGCSEVHTSYCTKKCSLREFSVFAFQLFLISFFFLNKYVHFSTNANFKEFKPSVRALTYIRYDDCISLKLRAQRATSKGLTGRYSTKSPGGGGAE